MARRHVLAGLLLIGLGLVPLVAQDSPTPPPFASKGALQKLNDLIGGWRGIGQVRRGSTSGAWQESGEFLWDFQKDVPAIRYVVADGKLMTEGRITWDANADAYRLALTTADQQQRLYRGNWDEQRLVFVSERDAEGNVHRLTITPLNDKRTLVLYEKRKDTSSVFSRVAEVGYTREGTRLAVSGTGQPECIVTGGLGTMTVSYDGKTYYVCCSGCKQAFEEDPAGILAEAAERLRQNRHEAPR